MRRAFPPPRHPARLRPEVSYHRPSNTQAWTGDSEDPAELVVVTDDLTDCEAAVYREEIW